MAESNCKWVISREKSKKNSAFFINYQNKISKILNFNHLSKNAYNFCCDKVRQASKVSINLACFKLSFLFSSSSMTDPADITKIYFKVENLKIKTKIFQDWKFLLYKCHGTIFSWSFSKSRVFFTPSQWLVLLKKALHYSKLHRKEAWSSITFVPILEHMVIFELHFLKIYMHYKGFLYYYMM